MDKLFNPNYLMHLCQKYGLRPSKKYGQNFLLNKEIVEKIVEAAEIQKSDTVLEIGPGFGGLTFALAEKAGQVVAYEIEKKLEKYWQENKPANVEIRWGNFLRNQTADNKVQFFKVAANLPYQITSAVIRFFLESENPPELMVFMVQKEVAERICAKPGEMSLLSVAVQYYAEPEIVAAVPRTNFWPEPKVDSAIIKIALNKQRSAEILKDKELFRLVKIGFANRRKLLIKNLEPLIGKKNKNKLKAIFSELGLKETARAQELGVEEWEGLSESI